MMAGEAALRFDRERIAAADDLTLEFPECSRGIGSVIRSLDSAELIEGVRLQPIAVWPDDRGYFLEVQRIGRGIAADFPPERSQISAALSYPGAIKAFHYHLHQTDCWTVAEGMLQVGLVDLRAGSPTFGVKNTIYVGVLQPWQILIPPGVGHGYKVIGLERALLIYMTDQFYNSRDEGRIAYNDPRIDYDWELQHK
jgi:dTDP-4-dehydrorhamnose 3,5-epimerase